LQQSTAGLRRSAALGPAAPRAHEAARSAMLPRASRCRTLCVRSSASRGWLPAGCAERELRGAVCSAVRRSHSRAQGVCICGFRIGERRPQRMERWAGVGRERRRTLTWGTRVRMRLCRRTQGSSLHAPATSTCNVQRAA
jgi:hypothetical protein